MSGFWTRLISLTRKEFRQLLRDRSNLAIGTPLEVRAQAMDGEQSEQRIDMEQAFIGIVEKARREGKENAVREPEGATA